MCNKFSEWVNQRAGLEARGWGPYLVGIGKLCQGDVELLECGSVMRAVSPAVAHDVVPVEMNKNPPR